MGVHFTVSPSRSEKFFFETSALQRSNLTDDVDLRFSRGHGLEGTSLVTVFAPTNQAFEALPKKLQFFLFSPFGARVLKKLLEFHIVPNAVIHSSEHTIYEFWYLSNGLLNIDYIQGEAVAASLDLPDQPPFEQYVPPPKVFTSMPLTNGHFQPAPAKIARSCKAGIFSQPHSRDSVREPHARRPHRPA